MRQRVRTTGMDESMALKTDVYPSPRAATPSCPPPTHIQSVRNICCDQWVSSSVSNFPGSSLDYGIWPRVGQWWGWRRRASSSRSSCKGTLRFASQHVLVDSALTRGSTGAVNHGHTQANSRHLRSPHSCITIPQKDRNPAFI